MLRRATTGQEDLIRLFTVPGLASVLVDCFEPKHMARNPYEQGNLSTVRWLVLVNNTGGK